MAPDALAALGQCEHCGRRATTHRLRCPACSSSLGHYFSVAPVHDDATRFRVARALGRVSALEDAEGLATRLGEGGLISGQLLEDTAHAWARILADAGIPFRRHLGLPDARARARLSRASILLLYAVAAVLGFGALRYGHDARALLFDEARPLSKAAREERMRESTVTLRCGEVETRGFFVAEALVATVASLDCLDAPEVTTTSGELFTGRIVSRQPERGIALVEVPGAHGAVPPLADVLLVEHGASVWWSRDGAPVEGTLAHPNRPSMGMTMIQLDLSVALEEFGAPVFDEYGRVLGMVAGRMSLNDRTGFALPANYLFDIDEVTSVRPSPRDDEAWRLRLETTRIGEDADVHDAEFPLGASMILWADVEADGVRVALLVRSEDSQPDLPTVRIVSEGQPACALRPADPNWRYVPQAEDTEHGAGRRAVAAVSPGLYLVRAAFIPHPAGCIPTRRVGVLEVSPGVEDRDRYGFDLRRGRRW